MLYRLYSPSVIKPKLFIIIAFSIIMIGADFAQA